MIIKFDYKIHLAHKFPLLLKVISLNKRAALALLNNKTRNISYVTYVTSYVTYDSKRENYGTSLNTM